MATRRWVIGAGVAAALGTTQGRAATHSDRIVVLDWGLAETLIALGAVPLGVGEAAGYARRVVEPALPPAVVDVGLRVAPNIELLLQLAPELILVPPWIGPARSALERVAPVMMATLYGDPAGPYAAACTVTRVLGDKTGRETAAEQLITQADAVLAAAAVRQAARRPLYVVSFIDAGHVAVYGTGSLFDDVLRRVGLRNAWMGAANATGAAVIGLEQLTHPDATLVTIGPALPSRAALQGNRLWTSLPCVAAGRVTAFPPIWFFGALPSAVRFARALMAMPGHDA